jgi:hypothetical protein
MADRNDVGGGAEAEAQSTETIMPWIWGAIGLAVIAVFVGVIVATAPAGHVLPHPPGVAPTLKPLGQHY